MFLTFSSQNLVKPLLALLAVIGLGLASVAYAQDDFSLPGDEPQAPAATAQADASAETGPTTLFSLIAAGGWAMWPLGALSIGLIGLAVYLFLDMRRKAFDPEELEQALTQQVDAVDLQSVLQTTEDNPSVLGKVMNSAANFVAERGYGVLGTDSLMDAIAETAVKANRGRAKLVNYFGTIAQAAPMVGLLGTVSGMIKAFANLGREGMGDPTKLAANISEALVTTATGLIIAIPAIFFYSFFRDKLHDLISRVDHKAATLFKRLNVALQNYTNPQQAAAHPPAAAAEPTVPTAAEPSVPAPPADPNPQA